MLFNSINFAIFLPVVFVLYWFVTNKSLTIQNILLLIASYFFYACWDWRFLFLLLFSTLLDYYTGIKMSDAPNHKLKKFWFWLSVCVNVGFLGVFKYYNFFAESFAEALDQLGIHVDVWTLNVILPVGISFYTFHGLSYVIDIYKSKIDAERNFVQYAVFVSFFPLLVAGPIERATHLLPQIKLNRVFNYSMAVDGLRQMLWGFFKKVVIADNCAEYVNLIFNHSDDYTGSTLMMGAFLFSFQVYGDFSGYSDIAIGTARIFGFNLKPNFAYPFFSRSITEFWRQWHMSLLNWFKDYIYFPLGGGKVGLWKKVRNTFIVFFISGLWHGANWTYILYGLVQAVYVLPQILFPSKRTQTEIVAMNSSLPSLGEWRALFTTFFLTNMCWFIFRANDMTHSVSMYKKVFSESVFSIPEIRPSLIIILIICFVLVEWNGRRDLYALEKLGLTWSKPLRWGLYTFIAGAIFILAGKEQQFIYFQF